MICRESLNSFDFTMRQNSLWRLEIKLLAAFLAKKLVLVAVVLTPKGSSSLDIRFSSLDSKGIVLTSEAVVLTPGAVVLTLKI